MNVPFSLNNANKRILLHQFLLETNLATNNQTRPVVAEIPPRSVTTKHGFYD